MPRLLARIAHNPCPRPRVSSPTQPIPRSYRAPTAHGSVLRASLSSSPSPPPPPTPGISDATCPARVCTNPDVRPLVLAATSRITARNGGSAFVCGGHVSEASACALDLAPTSSPGVKASAACCHFQRRRRVAPALAQCCSHRSHPVWSIGMRAPLTRAAQLRRRYLQRTGANSRMWLVIFSGLLNNCCSLRAWRYSASEGTRVDGDTLTRDAHVACGRCGFGMARSWRSSTRSVPVAWLFPSCSSVAIPFVLERLSDSLRPL